MKSESRFLATAVTLISLALIAIATIGLGSFEWWICDLLANLRAHTVLTLLLILPLQLYFKQLLLTSVTATVVAINVVTSVDQWSFVASEDSARATELVIISYNLGSENRDRSAASEFLNTMPADLIILQEYSFTWHEDLRQLSEYYPYSVAEPRDDNFGIALLSRYPLVDSAVQKFSGSHIPFVRSTVLVENQKIAVIGLNLQWPMLPSLFSERNEQIKTIITISDTSVEQLVVCGDWNMSSWSGWYRHVMKSGLHDGSYPIRLDPTWPAPLLWTGIPIDHCFASKDIEISTAQTGPSLGSDHRVILVEIKLTRRRVQDM